MSRRLATRCGRAYEVHPHRGVEAHVDGVDEKFNLFRRLVSLEGLEGDRVQPHRLLEFQVDEELLVAVARKEHRVVIAHALPRRRNHLRSARRRRFDS